MNSIRPEQVQDVFNCDRICDLAIVAKLPATAEFVEGVRQAASIYAVESRSPGNNEIANEVYALWRDASQQRYDRAARSLERLSPEVRSMLEATSAGASGRIVFPSPGDLRDVERRDDAGAKLISICSFGGSWIDGRKRPSGRRSRSWQPLLRAPPQSTTFAKRTAERDFLRNLRLVYLECTGTAPARTARRVNKGPGARIISGAFARFVDECLQLVGAGHVDAVELINEMDRRRRVMERCDALKGDGLSPNKS